MSKLTVFMPVYNTKAEYLRQAVDSILEQSYRDFEFLIINDGSAPYVRDILLSYDDPRVRYLENDGNRGQEFTRNRAIDEINNEYMATMDSDDISLPDRLEAQMEFMERNPEYGVLSGTPEDIGQDRRRNKPKRMEHDEIFRGFIFGNVISHPSCMLRMSVLKQNKIYYQLMPYAEDYAFFANLIFHTRFFMADRSFIQYRHHAGSVGRIHRAVQRKNRLVTQSNYIATVFGYDDYRFSREQSITFSDVLAMYSRLDEANHERMLFDQSWLQAEISRAVYHYLAEHWKNEYFAGERLAAWRNSPYWQALSPRRKIKTAVLRLANSLKFALRGR